MEQPTEASPATKQKKTADMAAYMRAYRLANLEKCRAQDRAQYHANKPTTDEAKMKKAQRTILNTLAKYPELLNNL
jgi:hypothetical protein